MLKCLRYFIPVLLALVLPSGCADDLQQGNDIFGTTGDLVAISYSVEGVSLTRAPGDPAFESEIDHAWLLFYGIEESGRLLAAVRADIAEDNPGQLSFKLPLRLAEGEKYRIVALANAGNYVPSGYNSFAEYIQSLSLSGAEETSDPLHIYKEDVITAGELLPMKGLADSDFSFAVKNGQYVVDASLSFRRLVSRIDIVNSFDGFVIEEAALCNWRDAVDVDSPDEGYGTVRGIEADAEADVLTFVKFPAIDSGSQRLTGALYCFPSYVEKSLQGDEATTAVILKGRFGDDTDASYYRVNVGIGGDYSRLKHNTKYTLSINSVKGRGEATAEEAYRSKESLITLSVVEEWDIDGNGYAMDEDGNFIIVSKSAVEFEGDQDGGIPDGVEIAVLTSNGLDWKAEYVASSPESDGAFEINRVADRLYIRPTRTNTGSVDLTGFCRVSAVATSPELVVDIRLTQYSGAEEIPPIAIIPQPGFENRVKISHKNRTIEIDGFAPEVFNSFIDVPFTVHIDEDIYGANATITVGSSSLDAFKWPSEGRISKERASEYYYSYKSFDEKQPTLMSSSGEVSCFPYNSPLTTYKNGETIYISVGAMGPDDPAIIRNIDVSYPNRDEGVIYKLIAKPRSIIIDDVIIKDEAKDKIWLIMDRNVQDTSASYKDKIGRLSQSGARRHAYNYATIGYPNVSIPFKFKDENSTIFDESFHEESAGLSKLGSSAGLSSFSTSRLGWLRLYQYSDNMDRTSPFYENANLDQWVYPNIDEMQLCAAKASISKMRVFLVSEVSALDGKNEIPICCYIPVNGLSGNWESSAYGYVSFNNNTNINSMVLIFPVNQKVETKKITTSSQLTNYSGYGRLVRELSADELEEYKNGYLGYGSGGLKLSIAHPDTWPWE